MIKKFDGGVFVLNGREIADTGATAQYNKEDARRNTIAYSILKSHNKSDSADVEKLKIKFDALTSHDITFVGVIQTAKASGMKEFPVPYVLTNCHNSLCAVGGTINEDDHMFGLSAAKKYGGIYVPPHIAVIHMYMREKHAGCGKMILGTDSHTRYGALGTMSIGEGGGELVKQLLGQTYDIDYPRVIGVHVTGAPRPGVGPQDVALAIIGSVFESGYVKNSVMEFFGDGIKNINTDYRCAIDVMTTETTCLSSIWETDDDTKEFLEIHGRGKDYKKLSPGAVAYYDGLISLNLSEIKPMIALPFHPSNAYEIETLNANLHDILSSVEKNAALIFSDLKVNFNLTKKISGGKLKIDQAVIAGCAGGTFGNVSAAAEILKGCGTGNDDLFLSVYPSSQPVFLELIKNGSITDLTLAGAIIRTAFCGPCFGAGDVPANGALSIRHTTRNFPNREGSKPGNGQIASVALMDARSIAATVRAGGFLTPATAFDPKETAHKYYFDNTPYKNRIYDGFGKPQPETELIYAPGIADWPEISPLPENMLISVASFITDPVTTTDELIPSGEAASFRSNPFVLAEFTLSRKDPGYVAEAKKIQALETERKNGNLKTLDDVLAKIKNIEGCEKITANDIGISSAIYAVKPGDGSAREQAASCQRVLGGGANIASEYATKRYRSNLMNWGMVPFLFDGKPPFGKGDFIFVPKIRDAVKKAGGEIVAYVIRGAAEKIALKLSPMTENEKQIILDGCLINYNKK